MRQRLNLLNKLFWKNIDKVTFREKFLSKFGKINLMKRAEQGFVHILLTTIFLSVAIALTFVAKNVFEKQVSYFKSPPSEEEERAFSQSSFRELLEENKETPVPSVVPTPSPKLSPSPKPKPKQITPPTPTPTPTPTPRIPNPPIVSIDYEMQNDRTCCVIDTPIGGDTSGLKRRHNINNQGWSPYIDVSKLCFEPKEGVNKISLQYKNSSGDETLIHVGEFKFHLIQDITVTISGQVYRDENCNGVKDSGETGVAGVTINFYHLPYYQLHGTAMSDNNGNYSFSQTIKENESLTLGVSGPTPVTLNSSNRTANLDLPWLPSSCY